MEDGIKQGIGVLSAFRDALEETIQEARDRGDLSADRAKGVMKEALDRAQAAAALFGPAFFMLEFIEEFWREPETTAPFVLAALGLLAPVSLLLVRRTLSRNEFMALLVITCSSLVTTLVVLWATANGLVRRSNAS